MKARVKTPEWVPDALGSLFILFLAQTMAITAFTQVLERWSRDFTALALLGVGLLFSVLVLLSYAWRERVRRRGTAVALIVKRQGDEWESIKEAAGRYQRDHGFRYWYPLVEHRPLPRPNNSLTVADWSEQFEACRGMLSMVFDETNGAPVDLRRIALMINTPLPLAYSLGNYWTDITQSTAPIDLVQLRDLAGGTDNPKVVWRSRRFDPISPQDGPSLAGLLVVRTVRDFNESWLDGAGPYEVVGSGLHLDSGSQATIDGLLDAVAQRVAELESVKLVLATTAPIAFAVGMRLRDVRDRITVLEYSGRQVSGYFPVSFRSTSKSSSPH